MQWVRECWPVKRGGLSKEDYSWFFSLYTRKLPAEDAISRVIEDHHGNRFLFSIAIIDLDPKSFDKIPSYIDDEQRIVDHYLKVTAESNQG